MEKYEVFIDAAWNSKYPKLAFGSYIIYHNGTKIEEGARKIRRSDNMSPEHTNLIYVLQHVLNKYLDYDKIQYFEIKTDSKGLDEGCNKIIKNHKRNVNYRLNYKDMSAEKVNLIELLKKYKNNTEFVWIPRETNEEANILAVEAFDKYVLINFKGSPKEFMRYELEYLLDKWKFVLGNNNPEVQPIIIHVENLVESLKAKL